MTRQQRRAAKRNEAKGRTDNGLANLTGTKHNFQTGIVFNVQEEFEKLVKITTSELAPYNTKSTLADFNGMTYKDNEGGFFIALLPRSGNGIVATEPNANRVRKAMDNFKLVPINQHWLMASCYCTKDRVMTHLDEITDNVAFAFVGYSQPNMIAPLAENPELCKALRDQTNPMSTLTFA